MFFICVALCNKNANNPEILHGKQRKKQLASVFLTPTMLLETFK